MCFFYVVFNSATEEKEISSFEGPEAEGVSAGKSLEEPRVQRRLTGERLRLRPQCMKSKIHNVKGEVKRD